MARAADSGSAFDLAAALLSALAAEPAVVIFEDLHWADEATLDVVRLFARRVADAKVLLVLSYREDELDLSTRCGSCSGTCQAAVRSPGWN